MAKLDAAAANDGDFSAVLRESFSSSNDFDISAVASESESDTQPYSTLHSTPGNDGTSDDITDISDSECECQSGEAPSNEKGAASVPAKRKSLCAKRKSSSKASCPAKKLAKSRNGSNLSSEGPLVELTQQYTKTGKTVKIKLPWGEEMFPLYKKKGGSKMFSINF